MTALIPALGYAVYLVNPATGWGFFWAMLLIILAAGWGQYQRDREDS